MGRRKIEIQPITHERNRSVTFLKRKNGLFKKAYELGVLCSVDVAVIVFDNKQGGPRLYQYGSDDVVAIVERAMRFEGDRDTKRPCDFNARALEDHEEEDEEDEEHAPARTSKKRTESGAIKPAPTSHSRPHEAPAPISPPNKRARVDSIEIPSDATPATSSSAPPLPPSLLHPSLRPLLAQALHPHVPSHNPQLSLAHLYSMIQQQSLSSESPAALLNLLRSGGLQTGRFNPQQSNQNPGLSEDFLASLAELASSNSNANDGISSGLGGGGAFDWPTGLGSSSNAQEPQHSTSRGGDDGPNWLDLLTVPPPNPVGGIPSLPLHNPQHPHPHPHHPTSFLNQRNFSTGPVSGPGYLPSLAQSYGGLSQFNLSRFAGSEDSRSGRRGIPLDSSYSPWNSDASSQSGRSDSSMSMFRPSQAMFNERDRRLELDDTAPGSVGGGTRGPLP